MRKLHEKQSKILDILKKNKENPLSIKQIMEDLEISSGVLYHHLDQLEKKGYLKRNPNNSKDYVVTDSPDSRVVYIAKYGMAQCGPGGSILDNNPIDQIPIASSLLRFSASEAFIVEAKGNSMTPKINSGDIIIAKKQSTADDGDIIVCVYDLEARIKKYSKENGNYYLVSFNTDKQYKKVEIKEEGGFKIEGIVKNIINYG